MTLLQVAVYLSVLHRTSKAPSDEGKRSAVAVVNDSPVDCQSRDRIARRQLSAKLTGGEKKRCAATAFSPSAPSGHLPRQREAGRSRATATER